MHRSVAIAILGFGLIVFGMVRADASTPLRMKIGYVDLQQTLNQTPAGRAAQKKLAREKKQKQAEVNRQVKKLEAYAAQLDKQRVLLKPEVLRQREQELQQRYVKLNQHFTKLQQDLAKRQAALVQQIFQKAAPIIKKIARREGYTMIIEKNQGAVVYADSSLDITAQVNRALH